MLFTSEINACGTLNLKKLEHFYVNSVFFNRTKLN